MNSNQIMSISFFKTLKILFLVKKLKKSGNILVLLLLLNLLVRAQSVSKDSLNGYPSYIDTNKLKELYQTGIFKNKGYDQIKKDSLKPQDKLQSVLDRNENVSLSDSSIKNKKEILKNKLNTTKTNIKDSLRAKIKNEKKALVVSKRDLSIHGTIRNQLDYGAIPYYTGNTSLPASLFKSDGSIKLRIKNLPLIGDYFYANPKFISGLNNYYTIRFDANEYKDIVNKKIGNSAKRLQYNIDSLDIEKQKETQKLAYLEAINIDTSKIYNPNLNIQDSLYKNKSNFKPDSFSVDTNRVQLNTIIKKDSLNFKRDSLNNDSLNAKSESYKDIDEYKKSDSIYSNILEQKRKIEEIEKQISKYKQQQSVLSNSPNSGGNLEISL